MIEASKICGVTRTTVWKWVKDGKLAAATTAGGHYRIKKEDLYSFIKEREMNVQIRGESKPRILIVDDDELVQNISKKILEKNGYETSCASDGFKAGLEMAEFKPNLILLDLYMPNMDGFELCKHIKKEKKLSKVKIIVITGNDNPENRKRILDLGADEILTKPIAKEALLNKVAELLNQ